MDLHNFLIVNCGSSSLKLAIYAAPAAADDQQPLQPRASALAERLGSDQAASHIRLPDGTKIPVELPAGADHQSAIERLLEHFSRRGLLRADPTGIGHRVVHGGEHFQSSVVIDQDTLDAIEACIPLAPLHNPANLTGIRILQSCYPKVPQVAVFDTAFHQSMPRHAFLYALPMTLYQSLGIRRYGFHGTSHRYMLAALAAHLNQAESETSLISAHLGNGCSVCAIHQGKSRDTSMGFTPLEGLVMGTRSGDVDPGLFAYLLDQGWRANAINQMLNRESGLLGLSGMSNDMRTLVEAASQGHANAAMAIEVFCFRLARYIAAMMASLSHCDALVFTGGIGENSARVRELTLQHLALLGFSLDRAANQTHGGGHGGEKAGEKGGEIQAPQSRRIMVIPTDEESVIARDVQRLVSEKMCDIVPKGSTF